jgi:DNA-binding CsgD family transcriptional regulator
VADVEVLPKWRRHWPRAPIRSSHRRCSTSHARAKREVLVLVARGLPDAETAERLFGTEATVKIRVGSVVLKLDPRDRVQVVVVAHEHGIAVARDRGSSTNPAVRGRLFEAPLAVELDDDKQSGRRTRRYRDL